MATLVRSALETITSWATCYDMLESSEFRTLQMLAVGDLSPPHWDTVPIAQTLHGAAHGFPDHPLLGSIMPKIIRDVLKLRKCCPDGGRFRLQRSIASELRKALYPESIPSLIKRRFSVLRPGVPYGSIDMDALKNFMMSLSVAWSTSIFKTWANAWTTSSRMHEHVRLSCVFGCRGASDELSHYLACPRFHRLFYPRFPGEEDIFFLSDLF